MEKKEFEKLREVKLTDEEFLLLLILTPAFSVAHADGGYDESEKRVMISIISNLIDEVYPELTEEDKENLIYAYLEDLDFISNNPYIEEQLILALMQKSKMIPGLAHEIDSFMKEIAEASEGINQEEKNKIEEISNILAN